MRKIHHSTDEEIAHLNLHYDSEWYDSQYKFENSQCLFFKYSFCWYLDNFEITEGIPFL